MSDACSAAFEDFCKRKQMPIHKIESGQYSNPIVEQAFYGFCAGWNARAPERESIELDDCRHIFANPSRLTGQGRCVYCNTQEPLQRESSDREKELIKVLNRTRSHAYAMYQHYCEDRQGHIDNCNWWTQGTALLSEIEGHKS